MTYRNKQIKSIAKEKLMKRGELTLKERLSFLKKEENKIFRYIIDNS